MHLHSAHKLSAAAPQTPPPHTANTQTASFSAYRSVAAACLPQASFTPLLLLHLEFFVSINFWPATVNPAALLIPLCGTAIPGCALRPCSGRFLKRAFFHLRSFGFAASSVLSYDVRSQPTLGKAAACQKKIHINSKSFLSLASSSSSRAASFSFSFPLTNR